MSQHQSWNRYTDFYRGSSYAAFPQEHRDSPGRLPFQMIMMDQIDHEFIDPSVPETVLALPLRIVQDNEWAWDMGDGWRSETAVPGRMLLLPSDRTSRWRVKGARQLLILAVPTKTIGQILGSLTPAGLQDAFLPLADKTWKDDFIELMMMRLWKATAGHNATDRLLVDGGLVTLISHLVERSEAIQKPLKFVALPAWRLRRVVEYADAHLHESLDLVALADAAGLSVRHFARAFREELNETPHRWLMAKRLERAKDMLKKNKSPVAEIAQACGFSGQSHFTKVFKELTGNTPKRWFHMQNAG